MSTTHTLWLTIILVCACIGLVAFTIREGFAVFNNSTRCTRNMSYDLRGDVPIPRAAYVFGNATIGCPLL
jgi:hypothetical protein